MSMTRSIAIVAMVCLSYPALGSRGGHSLPLSGEHRAIALRVAGDGLPNCKSYLEDGRIQPCLPAFVVKKGNRINAWSLGGVITFTEGAVRRLNHDEFAILVGHEIAHWYLGHSVSSPQAEIEADKLGLSLACSAGFNTDTGMGLFRHLRTSRSHGDAMTRFKAVKLAYCPQVSLLKALNTA